MCVGGRLLTGVILLLAIFAQPSFALDSSGEAVAVVQATNAAGPGGRRVLAEAQPVYSGDIISTGDVGLAQIRFHDETRLVVGPNSNVAIDRFVLTSDRSASGASIRFAKGTFRFITGAGPSANYRLQTPTATVGIRGTELDITVGGPRGTAVVVFDGAVQVCNRASGKCAVIDSSCSAAIATPDGGLSVPRSLPDRVSLVRTSFPLARDQSALRRGFRVSTVGCGGSPGNPAGKAGRVERAAARAVAPAPEPEPEPEPEPPSKPHKPDKPHGHHHGKHKGHHGHHDRDRHGHHGHHGHSRHGDHTSGHDHDGPKSEHGKGGHKGGHGKGDDRDKGKKGSRNNDGPVSAGPDHGRDRDGKGNRGRGGRNDRGR